MLRSGRQWEAAGMVWPAGAEGLSKEGKAPVTGVDEKTLLGVGMMSVKVPVDFVSLILFLQSFLPLSSEHHVVAGES